MDKIFKINFNKQKYQTIKNLCLVLIFILIFLIFIRNKSISNENLKDYYTDERKVTTDNISNEASKNLTLKLEEDGKVLSSYINGEFNGWSGESVYKLDNGEYWQQSEYNYSYDYEYHPEISIYQTSDGYKMHVDGYDGEDMEVHQIFDVLESRINGDYNGWEGETIYSLINGQTWQQVAYHYHYHYAYSPKVLIYKSGGVHKVQVEGDNDSAVSVMRLK